MAGWEAVAQAGQRDPGFDGWRNSLLDQAVNDLGINRLGLAVRSGSENSSDYYAGVPTTETVESRCQSYLTVNDNSDPRIIASGGFHFSEIDTTVVKVVLPMKQRLESRGEHLFVNLTYVSFLRQCSTIPPYVHREPSEYAEFMLAVFLHLRDTYGLVPDAVEVILEPDAWDTWTGTMIGRAIVATAARLSSAGFHPTFVAPSTADLGRGLQYIDDMYNVPGVQPLVGELAYHRYGVTSDDGLAGLAQRAAVHGARTSMLEHIGSGVDDLYTDLTIGQVSAWQQFALATPGEGDAGGRYYAIINGQAVLASRTRYLRQYFRYVRMGARRVAARSDSPELRPVGFQNADGQIAVVMHADRAGAIELRGLRPGRYGMSITTLTATGAELSPVVAGSDGVLRLTAPAVGVLTVYHQ